MNTYRTYSNVLIGEECSFGDFAIIGMPPRGHRDGELSTVLGNRIVIQSHALISAGNVFGDECIVGHSIFIGANNRFGQRVKLGALCVIERDNLVEDDVVFESQTGLAELTIVERGVWIGAHVSMASVLHPLCPKAKECMKGPHLYRGVTVGSAAMLYPDVRIGEGAYVEPGSIVMRDVRPYSVVAGNPAKEVGDIFTLYPGRLERIEPYVDLSQDSIIQAITRFEEKPGLFQAQ